MAIMIPSIPRNYTPESDEDMVFYAFNNLPGDPKDQKNDYYVFHSFKINHINKDTNTFERHETDFIIFHPSKGMICIECKSGTYGKMMVKNGAWHRAKIENGILKPIKKMQHGGPFNQAEDRMNDLVSYVGKQNIYLHGGTTEKLKDHCKIVYAVCFPKIATADEEYLIEKDGKWQIIKFKNFLSAAEPKELVVYGQDLQSPVLLKQKIDDIYAYKMKNSKGEFIETGNKGERLHDEDIQNLFDRVLCPNFNIVETIDSNTGVTKYIQLNEDQIRLLDILMTKKLMAVSGMAGTGKTILALQLARKKAMMGENVLFLCRSSQQKKELEKKRLNSNIEFRDIEWLNESYNYNAAIDNDNVEGKGKNQPDFYGALCERIIEEKFAAGEIKFGKHGKRPSYAIHTLLVDEAQDFCKEATFDCLNALYNSIKGYSNFSGRNNEALLRQRFRERTLESKNSFYIFYDEFQTDDDSKILEFVQKIKNHIELKKNCRNTVNIAKAALRPLIDVDYNYCQRKDAGEKVIIDFYESKEIFNHKLEEWKYYNEFYYEEEFCFKLDNILKNYGITPENTIILTLKGEDSAHYSQIKKSVLFDYSERLVDREGKTINADDNCDEDLEIFYKLDEDRLFFVTNWKNLQGLEKRNVIIVDFEPSRFFDEENESYAKKFYVTLTRAQDFCFILSLEPDYDTGFEYSDMCEQAPGEYDEYNTDDVTVGDIVISALLEEYGGYDDSIKAFMLLDKDEDFWKSVGNALENEDQEAIAEYCQTYEIDERLLEKCYEEYYYNSDEYHIEMIETEERVHDHLNPTFLNNYEKGRLSASMRKAIAEALGAENVFNYDVKHKLEDNYLEKMVFEVEKVGIPKELFYLDIFNMKDSWQAMRCLVNNRTDGFFKMVYLEPLETYGLNLEFVKNEYERLMNLNIRNDRKKLSKDFWEKFKLTRDTGIISKNYITETHIKIGEERLFQLDKIEKEVMEYLIHLNMKYGS